MERPTADEVDLHAIAPSDGPEAIPAVVERVPDVVLVSLPPGLVHPLQLCREVSERAPVTRVVIQAGADQAANVYQALRVGAAGWVDADASPAEVREVAEAVAGGEARLAPRHAAWVLRELGDGADGDGDLLGPPSPGRVTATERTVLRLLAEGAAPSAIGEHLGISPRVVGRHAGSALARLHRHYRRPSEATGGCSPAVSVN